MKATKKYNFYAGPAILPESVLHQAASAVTNFDNMGLSILEISHRSPNFTKVMQDAQLLAKELTGAGDEFEALFLTGGASSQFFMTAMNLLNTDETAAYINTGTWSTKAIKEAKLFGNIVLAASSEDDGYRYIPKQLSNLGNAKYLHYTSNNTIYGTQYHQLPDTTLPLIGDLSSDIFSRPVDLNRHAVIYAGAQKNMGPAGTTLVLVRKDMLGRVKHQIPTLLDYRTHINKGSMFNTPPVYAVYVSMLTMRWVAQQGGPEAMASHNSKKAAMLYKEIDNNSLFTGYARKEDRSKMNVTFNINDETLENAFVEACSEAGIVGIKGHRSVGGFRASIYNAMPVEGVEKLVDVMQTFSKQHGA